MITLAINQLGVPLPNTEKYIKYCLNSVSNLVNEQVRVWAAKTLPQLVISIKHSGIDPSKVMTQQLSKVIIKVIIFSCTLELDPKVICQKIESACDVLALVPEKTFSADEISQNYKILLQILSKLKIETTTLKTVKIQLTVRRIKAKMTMMTTQSRLSSLLMNLFTWPLATSSPGSASTTKRKH